MPTCRWKINVSVHQDSVGEAYIGGFIRDTNGDWVKGFSGYIGWLRQLDAQLKAIQHALQFGWELQKPRVVLETDFLLAVKAIDEGDENYIPIDEDDKNHITIRNIRDLIDNLPWFVEIKHVKREANQAASHLANELACRQARVHRYSLGINVLDKPPREIANILYK